MKTLGQVAYEAFNDAVGVEDGVADWDVRQDHERAAWERSALEVRDAVEAGHFPRPLLRPNTRPDDPEWMKPLEYIAPGKVERIDVTCGLVGGSDVRSAR